MPSAFAVSSVSFTMRWMRDDAVQGAAAVKRIEAHPGAAAQPHLAPIGHVGRVGRQHQVDLDGDIGGEGLGQGQCAAKIEFFLHGEGEMDGGAGFAAGQSLGNLDQHSTTGAIIDRGSGDAVTGQVQRLWVIDDGRADADAGRMRPLRRW